jgi:hypothetical protein
MMKKIGEYTCLGRMLADDIGRAQRITLFDGKFTTGFKITEFRVAPADVDNTGAALFVAKLLTTLDGGAGAKEWDWNNPNELAWAMCGFDANSGNAPNPHSWIDDDNLIVEDLFIQATENTDLPLNYMIKMEKYQFSDSRGALAMVRNRAQA